MTLWHNYDIYEHDDVWVRGNLVAVQNIWP